MLSVVMLLSLAHAGYGDVDTEGRPSWSERQLHLWTNAVRVDPEAFSADYRAGGCDFDDFLPAEQQKLPPLSYDPNLNEAARFHSTDMRDHDHFSHDSSDGTSFSDRIGRYYDSGYAGENISWGYADAYVALVEGWMCSDGHRANIMTGGFTELGTGVVDLYYTQNLGGGTPDTRGAVGMAVHEPGTATDGATFYADWSASGPPARLQVVVDGVATELALAYGDADQGVYAADVSPDAADCHTYWFHWEEPDGTEGAFPEDGSYTYGRACTDRLGWVDGHPEADTSGGDDSAGGDDGGSGDEGGSGDDGGSGDGGSGDSSGSGGGADGDTTEADEAPEVDKGGCSATGLSGGTALAALGLLAVGRRRA